MYHTSVNKRSIFLTILYENKFLFSQNVFIDQTTTISYPEPYEQRHKSNCFTHKSSLHLLNWSGHQFSLLQQHLLLTKVPMPLQYFSLYRAVSQRDGDRNERHDKITTNPFNFQPEENYDKSNQLPARTYCRRIRSLSFFFTSIIRPPHWRKLKRISPLSPQHSSASYTL